ncbi:hypothetical protein KIW84_031199 [Lathyrus oleraceus]|uniref:Uncharacterized protein n=1 Tax=Pisum sativum TaxID=3888 RepID=A0A9D4XV68_PEA|nr:hypothetical protein KIW84_031199 [Pisum sativum]
MVEKEKDLKEVINISEISEKKEMKNVMWFLLRIEGDSPKHVRGGSESDGERWVELRVEVARKPLKEGVNPPSPVKPKAKLEKGPKKEGVNPPLSTNKEEVKDEDLEMIVDNSSDLEDDFDVLCNMASVLPIEYDVLTKVTNVDK